LMLFILIYVFLGISSCLSGRRTRSLLQAWI